MERVHRSHLKSHRAPPPSVRKLLYKKLSLPIKINAASWHRQQALRGSPAGLLSTEVGEGQLPGQAEPRHRVLWDRTRRLAPPVGTAGSSAALPDTATPWGLPGCFPLPTSPSRLPAHLSDLRDEVPTPTPWTPDIPPPSALVSSIFEALLPPRCRPHTQSSSHCIYPRRLFQPGTSTQVLRGVGHCTSLCVSSSLKTNLRTLPSKTPPRGPFQQRVLQR